MLTIAQGHHDQRSRRARVQNGSTPLGRRERSSRTGRRYPLRRRLAVHARGRLLGLGRIRSLPVPAVLFIIYRNCLPRCELPPAAQSSPTTSGESDAGRSMSRSIGPRPYAEPIQLRLAPCLLFEFAASLAGHSDLATNNPITARREAMPPGSSHRARRPYEARKRSASSTCNIFLGFWSVSFNDRPD